MLPLVVATGMSSPAWTMPLKTVAIGVPVLQAINACGLAALMCSICAATLTSVMLKWARSTTVMSLFSGRARDLVKAVLGVLSGGIRAGHEASRVQPLSRK